MVTRSASQEIGAVLPADASQEDIIRRIKDLNNDDRVSGIMVQLPLPPYMSSQAIFDVIRAEKDVDGVTPANHVGNTYSI